MRHSRRRKYDKSGRKKKIALICLACFIVLAALGTAGWFYVDSLAYEICYVEAGVAVSPSDFLRTPDENAFFTEDSGSFDIAEPGEYHVKVKSGLFTHSCTLFVTDTVPPEAEASRVKLEMGQTCGAEEFVTNITDATEVTAAFVTEPDFSEPGKQTVQVVLRDKGNNETVIESELFISQVVNQVTVEAGGEAPELEAFVIAGEEAELLTDLEAIDYTVLGSYPVSLRVDGEVYTSEILVVDTIPPEAEVHDIEGYTLVPRAAEDFVTFIEDVTEVSAAFRTEPDLSKTGTQQVDLIFTDCGGNTTERSARLTLEEDTEPPVISGAVDFTVYTGDSVSYKRNVKVTDNCPEGLTLEVDTDSVNIEEVGIYPVTYTAKDYAGNVATVTVNLTVSARTYSEETVNALADAVLASIITEDMSELDKVSAIYKYNMSHIGYISHSDKGDWVKAAYEGLTLGQGDCYVYASTAKVLLTRAGIANMDIAKSEIPGLSLHFWNLVDIGDGWYHLDTTPRVDHPKIFMWTDEELMAYSEAHKNSHIYDHLLYPEVN